MAGTRDLIHDLLDANEDLNFELQTLLREQVLSRIDLARLADPNDAAYDRVLAEAVFEAINSGMLDAYRLGARHIEALFGASSIHMDAAGPLLGPARVQLQVEVRDDVAQLGVNIDRAVNRMVAQGLGARQIVETISRDLEALGPSIFGPFARSVYSTIERTVGAAQGVGLAAETVLMQSPSTPIGDVPIEAARLQFIWACALVNTCHDCLPRMGQTRTYAEWVADGLPKGDWSVCSSNCKCTLQPADLVDRVELMEPLRRFRVEGLHQLNARGVSARLPSGLTRPEAINVESRRNRIESIASQYQDSAAVRRAMRAAGQADARR